MALDTSRRPRHLAAEIYTAPRHQWLALIDKIQPPEWRELVKAHLRAWHAKARAANHQRTAGQ